MMESDLRTTERAAFTATTDTGLRDIIIASVVSIFAIAPLLSERMGDFWSSAVFLPVWALVFLVTRVVNKLLVEPRLGEARWGDDRKSQMKKMGMVMLVVNIVALFFGMAAWFMARNNPSLSWLVPAPLAVIVLVLFSALSHAYSVRRYFYYGAMLAVAPFLGEWLFQQGYASHHGFPVMFGLSATVIALFGLQRLFRILRQPVPDVGN